jgi:hypothetical protein
MTRRNTFWERVCFFFYCVRVLFARSQPVTRVVQRARSCFFSPGVVLTGVGTEVARPGKSPRANCTLVRITTWRTLLLFLRGCAQCCDNMSSATDSRGQDLCTLAKNSATYARAAKLVEKYQTHAEAHEAASKNHMAAVAAHKIACKHAERCRRQWLIARTDAQLARSAHDEYVHARPFIGLVRKQQIKARALLARAAAADAHVAPCAANLDAAAGDAAAANRKAADANEARKRASKCVLSEADRAERDRLARLVAAERKLLSDERETRRGVVFALEAERRALQGTLRPLDDAVFVLEAKERGMRSIEAKAHEFHAALGDLVRELHAAREKSAAAHARITDLDYSIKTSQSEVWEACEALRHWDSMSQELTRMTGGGNAQCRRPGVNF